MYASELLSIVREDFLDDAANALDGDEAGYRFSTPTLLRHIGEAQRQACYRQDLKHLFDSTTPEICEIAITAETSSYLLDPRILRIEVARLAASYPLQHVSRAWMEANRPTWRWAEAGTPSRFFIIGRILYVDPIPLTSSTLYLSVWREPLETPDADSELEWTLDPEKLAHWVAFRCFLKPDEDSYNEKLAAEHRALFDLAFGTEVPARARADLLAYPAAFAPFDAGGCIGSSVITNFETET